MKWPMLTRRGVTYYHRQVVPLALRPFLETGGSSGSPSARRTSRRCPQGLPKTFGTLHVRVDAQACGHSFAE